MIQDLVIAISGLPRHGKSTTAQCLSTLTGLAFNDCSSVIYDELASREGVTVADLRQQDKGALRSRLIALGDELCENDPGHLAKRLLASGIRIISGVRKSAEIEAIREKCANVLHLWVEALEPDQEARFRSLWETSDAEENFHVAPARIHDNTDLAIRGLADFVVPNFSTDHLVETLRFIIAKHGLSQ